MGETRHEVSCIGEAGDHPPGGSISSRCQADAQKKLGIPKTTFYRWYDRHVAFGEASLEDRSSNPGQVWNRIPDNVRQEIILLALEEMQLSPRELAVTFTDTRRYFVSEVSVYRLLKAHDLITSPAFIVIKAADDFRDETPRPPRFMLTPSNTDDHA